MRIETLHQKFPGEGESIAIAATDVSGVIGTATIGSWNKPVPYLWLVFVAESYRRRGIARQMLTTAIDMARNAGKESITLWVKKDNQRAVDLYRSLGFITAGNEDPVMMIKPLGDTASGARPDCIQRLPCDARATSTPPRSPCGC